MSGRNAFIFVQKEEDAPYTNAKLFKSNGVLSIVNKQYLSAFKDLVVNTPETPSSSDFDVAMMLTGS
ncbi:hypothetical protein CHS0354_025002 [Potamilus streckersoni]|uniref:Uncharacterized protein n=1 Tax=Potamilus streckersoni TaxID=2493646 RepID=A0AAE0SR88_9BIVA|nr:hypothetical protein CHS0354_025002 [Potamilus streckersoni]